MNCLANLRVSSCFDIDPAAAGLALTIKVMPDEINVLEFLFSPSGAKMHPFLALQHLVENMPMHDVYVQRTFSAFRYLPPDNSWVESSKKNVPISHVFII